MGKEFDVLLFKGLYDYTKKRINRNELTHTIEMFFERTEGHTTKTSCWMNRYCLLENEEKHFIIIPSNIPCNEDIAVATMGKYIIFCVGDEELLSISDADEKYFLDELPKLFSPENRRRKAEEYKDEMFKANMFQSYRIMFGFLGVENALFVRTLFQEQKDDYTDWAFNVIHGDSEAQKRLYLKYKDDNKADIFANELVYLHNYCEADPTIRLLLLIPVTHKELAEEPFLRATERKCLEIYKPYAEINKKVLNGVW